MNQYLKTTFKFCPRCQNQLDRQGNKVNCSQCGFEFYLNPAPAVTVLVTQNHQLLLIKRAIEPQLGQWDLPGGFIESNETAEDATLREVREETNLTVKIKVNLGTTTDIYGPNQLPTLNYIFLTQVISGQAQPQDDAAQLSWTSIDKIPPKLAFNNCLVAIHRYQEYLLDGVLT